MLLPQDGHLDTILNFQFNLGTKIKLLFFFSCVWQGQEIQLSQMILHLFAHEFHYKGTLLTYTSIKSISQEDPFLEVNFFFMCLSCV